MSKVPPSGVNIQFVIPFSNPGFGRLLVVISDLVSSARPSFGRDLPQSPGCAEADGANTPGTSEVKDGEASAEDTGFPTSAWMVPVAKVVSVLELDWVRVATDVKASLESGSTTTLSRYTGMSKLPLYQDKYIVNTSVALLAVIVVFKTCHVELLGPVSGHGKLLNPQTGPSPRAKLPDRMVYLGSEPCGATTSGCPIARLSLYRLKD